MSLDVLYYRLALASAKDGDLSGAVRHAGTALSLNAENELARQLLNICLYAINGPVDASEELSGIITLSIHKNAVTGLVARRRGMSALRAMYQSVRVLNIQGCVCAMSGRYREAARFFALTLEKDKGNALAAAALADIALRRKYIWRKP